MFHPSSIYINEHASCKSWRGMPCHEISGIRESPFDDSAKTFFLCNAHDIGDVIVKNAESRRYSSGFLSVITSCLVVDPGKRPGVSEVRLQPTVNSLQLAARRPVRQIETRRSRRQIYLHSWRTGYVS